MSDKRDAVLRRIRQLRNLTEARGCTEAEAMAAAAKMAQLMTEYGIGADDVDIEEDAVKVSSKGRILHRGLWSVIAHCTDTAVILINSDGESLKFFGLAPGPSIAVYLHQVTDRAIYSALREFRKSDIYKRRRTAKTRRAAEDEFRAALIYRLQHRLIALFPARSEGRRALANEALSRAYNSAKSLGTVTRKRTNDAARSAGWVAGGAVTLGHGVEEDFAEASPLDRPPLALPQNMGGAHG